jgi:hypothetical protein
MYCSPREILAGKPLDCEKNRKVTSLSYVLTHDEPKPSNTLASRPLECLYLRPAPHSEHGGHESWHIATGQVINRHSIPIPVMASVITTVEEAAKMNNVKGFVLNRNTE